MEKLNVLCFLYNRPEHTKKTITSLLENSEPINKIFFYIDKAKCKFDTEKQEEIKEFLYSIMNNNPNITYEIIERTTNLGIATSIVTATNQYSTENTLPFIVIEDDCKPRKHFIDYMLYSLYKFKDNLDIYTVCGYQYEEDKSKKCNIELSTRFNPWGWGSWPHKWNFDWFRKIDDKDKAKLPTSLLHYANDKSYLNGEKDIWSVTVAIKQYLNFYKTVVPTRSLVENIGFDGTGVHSTQTNVFNNKEIDIENIVYNNNIELNAFREEEIEISLQHKLSNVMNLK